MNIAFPAIVIFLLVMPGILFQGAVKKTENKSESTSQSLAHLIGSSLLSAVFLHILFGLIATQLDRVDIDFKTLFVFMTSHQAEMARAIDVAASNFSEILTYFILLFLFSSTLGWFIRWAIDEYKLDTGSGWLAKHLKNDTPWADYFSDRHSEKDDRPDAVLISAVSQVGSFVFIYEGFLDQYRLDKDGKLERIILHSVSRRLVSPSDNEPSADCETCDDSDDSEDHGVVENPGKVIIGDALVIPMSEVKNFVIEYIYISETN